MKKTFFFIIICLLLIILISPTTSITAIYASNMASSFYFHIPAERVASEREIEYDGLYYIRDDDPNQIMDEGSLLRNPPIEQELICCGLYVILRFAEDIQSQAELVITNIYYHIWQKAPELPFEGEEFEWGYSTSPEHNAFMNESLLINTSSYITAVHKYRLVQALQYTNPAIATFQGSDISNFNIKSVGEAPKIISQPNQQSFIILNIDDNQTLQTHDRDCDYLSDYEELFQYYTNPYDIDTDNDGATDYDEVTAYQHGYSNSDPNNPSDTTAFRELYARTDGPYYGLINTPIQFNGRSFGGFPPYTYLWNFGDGSTASQQIYSHTYNHPGEYSISLLVTDNQGKQKYDNTTVLVNAIYLDIIKPQNGIYYASQRLLPFMFPLIIGPIEINIDVWDFARSMDSIEFWVDDKLQRIDNSTPYTWFWDNISFKGHTLTFILHDSYGNTMNSKLKVVKIF